MTTRIILLCCMLTVCLEGYCTWGGKKLSYENPPKSCKSLEFWWNESVWKALAQSQEAPNGSGKKEIEESLKTPIMNWYFQNIGHYDCYRPIFLRSLYKGTVMTINIQNIVTTRAINVLYWLLAITFFLKPWIYFIPYHLWYCWNNWLFIVSR